MAFRLNEWFSRPNPCRPFSSNELLFQALARQESAAILCLQEKSALAVRKITRDFGLSDDRAEEILNRATLIFLQKIADGAYQFRGHAPSTFLIEIAKNLARMTTRERRRTTDPLDEHQNLPDLDLEKSNQQADAAETIRQLLDRLGNPCAQIIRLQHIEGVSDEEAVNQRLTRYSTTDSLKVKRHDCMKKLIELAKKWKI